MLVSAFPQVLAPDSCGRFGSFSFVSLMERAVTDRDKALSSRAEENKADKDGGIILSKGREETRGR